MNSGQFRRNRFFVIMISFLTALLITVQLYFLSDVGTKGEELNNIRLRQSELKVENEMLKAKILELRSNKVVLEDLNNRSTVSEKKVDVIDPEILDIKAQN